MVPAPAPLSMPTVPPWAWTIAFTIESPSPEPPAWRDRAGIGPVEALEGPGGHRFGHSGSVVVHLEHGVGPVAGDPHLHRGSRRRVHERVADQVGHHLAQPALVALDRDPFGHRRRHRSGRIDGPRVADRVDGEHAEIDGARFERAALVESGQEQEVVDERAHAHRFLLGAPHRLRQLLGVVETAAAVELGVAADRGHRRPQLVRRVGDELAQARLRRGALVERALDLRHHRVERDAQLARLGSRRDLGHAVREVAAGDRGRGLRSSA